MAVVDFDVHHGNGTQDIFWSDPRVLLVSSHQYPFYPGTGSLEEQGRGAGEGFTVNLPMPAGGGDAEYEAVYREIVLPIVRRFDPQLVIASAGFDAAAGDPLAGMRVSPAGFRALADVCVAAASGAAQGRVVAVLEGGYGEDGLASGARALVGRLLETDPPLAGAARTSPGVAALVASFRQAHQRHWPVLRD